MTPGTYTVRATRDFRVGSRHDLAIAKGQTRVVNADGEGQFCTYSDSLSFFGVCRIGDGWEIVP